LAKFRTLLIGAVGGAAGYLAGRKLRTQEDPPSIDLLSDPVAYLVIYQRLSENLLALQLDLEEGRVPSEKALTLLSEDLGRLNDLHPLGQLAGRVAVCQLLSATA
jgi:hypothetical protein